jgi:ribose/xylose/arabinose/galactoside ABC-type transport system permease subunit
MSLRAVLLKIGPLLGLIGVFVFFVVAVWIHSGRNNFATWDNVQTVVVQSAIVGTAALGMTMIIISGGIDLSMGSMVALTSVMAAALMKSQGWSGFPAACGAVVLGALCGAVNGLTITQFRVVPFIATLGTYLILRGAAKGIADERTITPGPSVLDKLLDQGSLFSPGVWILALLAAGVSVLLHYTRFGRHVFAIGSNEQAARLCGVAVSRTKVSVYALGGMFAGIAGVFQYSRLTIGDPTAAPGLELDVIAAVVIGGGSLAGGEGSIVGSLIGALFMTTIRRGCAYMDWASWVTEIVAGTIIVIAAGLDRLRHRGAK